MEKTIAELEELFAEARARSEFDFVITLLNYQGMASEISPTLLEWFDAIEFYKKLFVAHSDKEKARMGLLLYSTFFENSDFYNIIGSLCRIKLGFRGSSYLFWKTKKYERLLGIGEKEDYLVELLDDCAKLEIISFFENNHYKEIRNTFFHAAYSIEDDDYHLHDSDAIVIGNVRHYVFSLENFFYPIVDNVIQLFDCFKKLYQESWASYTEEFQVQGNFLEPVIATILGSEQGLRGFRIDDGPSFYGQPVASGIWYDENYQIWAGHNIRFSHTDVETLEIREQLTRFENKPNIKRKDYEFNNLVDKVKERNRQDEIARAILLLVKFGDARFSAMEAETNQFKKGSYPKMIVPFYEKAIEINKRQFDLKEIVAKNEVLKAAIQ